MTFSVVAHLLRAPVQLTFTDSGELSVLFPSSDHTDVCTTHSGGRFSLSFPNDLQVSIPNPYVAGTLNDQPFQLPEQSGGLITFPSGGSISFPSGKQPPDTPIVLTIIGKGATVTMDPLPRKG